MCVSLLFLVNACVGVAPANFNTIIKPFLIALGAFAPSGPCSSAFANVNCDGAVNLNENSLLYYGCDNQSRLTFLSLYDCALSGSIDSSIGLMSALTYLALENNSLVGTVPTQIYTLTNLQSLSLAENNLTGATPLTSGVGALSNLNNLWLYFNNFVLPTLPDELYALTLLTYLDFSTNTASGTLSPSVQRLSRLTALSASNCYSLSGTLPTQLATLTKYVSAMLFHATFFPSQTECTLPREQSLLRHHTRIACLAAAAAELRGARQRVDRPRACVHAAPGIVCSRRHKLHIIFGRRQLHRLRGGAGVLLVRHDVIDLPSDDGRIDARAEHADADAHAVAGTDADTRAAHATCHAKCHADHDSRPYAAAKPRDAECTAAVGDADEGRGFAHDDCHRCDIT
jgi:hypothetical protein